MNDHISSWAANHGSQEISLYSALKETLWISANNKVRLIADKSDEAWLPNTVSGNTREAEVGAGIAGTEDLAFPPVPEKISNKSHLVLER
jgi:hypothetical protein